MTMRLGLLSAVAAAVAIAGAPPAAEARAPVQPVRQTVTLLSAHTVVSAPHHARKHIARVRAFRPITGTETVLPVYGRTTTRDGVRWLRVAVPGRPNSRTGWIARRRTVLSRTGWHLVVRTSSRRVRVYRGGRLVRTFRAVVGTPSTPTPHGRFFVEESVRMAPGAAGGPFALATSARSNVLQEFEGGPGQIALHGVANLGGTPGTAASHGCVRLANHLITWLIRRIAPGVPVTIRP